MKQGPSPLKPELNVSEVTKGLSKKYITPFLTSTAPAKITLKRAAQLFFSGFSALLFRADFIFALKCAAASCRMLVGTV